jgi:TonB-dependent SusC/RagA subfamily outer membrane receptor
MKRQFLQLIFKGFILLLISPFTFPVETFAQNSVSGKVKDSKNEPIPGVSVRVKGTTIGVTTDVNGDFKIAIPASQGYLVFSSIGYSTTEIQLDKRSVYEVILAEDNKFLNEVVVTALGIKREEKSLGFAAQTINANAVVDAKTNNWVNSLSGKVAGLNIQGAGAGPMGSSRITLRGESSLNLDNNQALIVVDGVPISSKITGTGFNSHLAADSPVDYGSGVSDINPDDIENVTVLKGPGATALYGSRAAGGVIIITTKSGVRKDGSIGITFNSNFRQCF